MGKKGNNFWSGFNPGNMSEKHRGRLMNDVYGPMKTKKVSVRGRRGKYGYGKSTTANVLDLDYYNGRGWDEVGQHIGIQNVTSMNEVRRLYDYMHGYKPPAPAAGSAAPPPPPPPPARAPTPTKPTNNYQSQIASLTARIADQQKATAAAEAASRRTDTERDAAAKASQAQYQRRLSDVSASFDSRLLQQQQGFDASLAQKAAEQTAFLNDLQIKQDTRLDKIALDVKTRADDLALGQRTYQQNQSRSNQLSNLQIGGREAPQTGGTQGFKRRKLQVNPVTANALSGILGGTAATSSTNTLNV